MRVLVVSNNAHLRGNGLCTAVLSLVRRLQAKGIETRIMACENPDPEGPQPDYPLKHFKIPVFEPLVFSSGFRFATFDKEMATRAIEWADVIHICEGCPMEAKVVKLAKKLNTPCVGTFHLFAENIMANVGLRQAKPLSYLVTQWWRKSVFDHCTHLHCPTETVKQYLLDNHYKTELRVITNGMDIEPTQSVQTSWSEKPIIILCIGRYAHEKSQKTLLEAMRYSKYARKIQLHFAGKGPLQNRYKKMAKSLLLKGVLHYPPQFGFYNYEELKKLIHKAYLYIHCAWVEVEGLSCLEAIKEGVVPVIAKGKLTATSQFALDERSVFPESDARALAAKIDWWIEHPEERAKMGVRYAESVEKYNAEDSTAKIIEMYKDSINR